MKSLFVAMLVLASVPSLASAQYKESNTLQSIAVKTVTEMERVYTATFSIEKVAPADTRLAQDFVTALMRHEGSAVKTAVRQSDDPKKLMIVATPTEGSLAKNAKVRQLDFRRLRRSPIVIEDELMGRITSSGESILVEGDDNTDEWLGKLRGQLFPLLPRAFVQDRFPVALVCRTSLMKAPPERNKDSVYRFIDVIQAFPEPPAAK